MHEVDDPNAAEPSPGPQAQGPPLAASVQAAEEAVRRVIAWYNQQIMQEQRSARPDEARMQILRERRQEAITDQQALEDADPASRAAIAARYAALHPELRKQE